jgi:hypothetical protein
MPSCDNVSWIVELVGHGKCKQGQKALKPSSQVQQKNVQPYYKGVQPYITMWCLWGINKIYVLV